MSNFFYHFTKTVIKYLSLPFIKLDYKSNWPRSTRPKIYAANHPSTLDPVLVMSALKDTVSILITNSVFQIPIIGYLIRKSGHIPVVSDQGNLAYQHALKQLKAGHSILIFPEGRLSAKDGITYPPFSGVIRLALETKAPIVPIGISFAKDKTFTKKIKIKKNYSLARFFWKGKYSLTSGIPMHFSGNLFDKFKINSQKCLLMNTINSLAEESALRLYRIHR